MKHTKGKAEVFKTDYTTCIFADGYNICDMATGIKDLNIANAELIAEAFNVTNECGFTPRQLLDKLNIIELDAYQRGYNEAMSKAKELIDNQFKVS